MVWSPDPLTLYPQRVPGWGNGAETRAPVYEVGWRPDAPRRKMTISAAGTLDMTATARYPRNLMVAAESAVDMVWSQIEGRALAVGITAEVLVSAVARQMAEFGVSAGADFVFDASTGRQLAIDVLAGFEFTAMERFLSSAGVMTNAAQSYAALERYPRDIGMSAGSAQAFSATQIDQRGLGLSADAVPSFSGFERQFSAYGFSASTGYTNTAGFPTNDAQSHTITTTGTHQFIAIPYWARYIDVILLGGGGGGAGGNQAGADGRGGNSGVYSSNRWDRGVSRNGWTQLAILLGNGGSGGSRNNNGSGGSGGGTELWIDDSGGWTGQYLRGAGGSGGSGTNPVLGNERPGKSPGNHTFQGITATGGGGNSSAPGSGGQGGGGAVWPLSSGSGAAGARGQAWVRFSM